MSQEAKLKKLFSHKKVDKPVNKTLLLDFSGIAHSTFHRIKADYDVHEISEMLQMWKYYILNSIRSINSTFKPDEFIVAFDNSSWRFNEFQYYKARRKIAKEESGINYNEFKMEMNNFLSMLKKDFPFIVVGLKKAEADDVVAILIHELKEKRKEIVIVSEDKDFKQFIDKNIKLYSNKKKEFIKCDDPKEFLVRLILKGDSGDDIPNVRSDDDTFIIKEKRQKPCGDKGIDKIFEQGLKEWLTENKLEKNFKRNVKLIELSKRTIPNEIWNGVQRVYDENKSNVIKPSFREMFITIKKLGIPSFEDKVKDFMVN